MENNNVVKKTYLYKKHIALGSKMVTYSGFIMPLQYKSSIVEHMHVRNHSGIFDISHMGKIFLKGKDSKKIIQFLTTNDINHIKIGQAQYNCMVNHKGGIIDDLVIYKISETEFLLIVNAINTEKNKKWINHYIHIKKYKNINIIDYSNDYSILSVQGPRSLDLIQNLTNISLNMINFYHFKIGKFSGIENLLISRTGYTGSKGVEIIIPNEYVEIVWDNILKISNNIIPCGIASRDSLRLEMGYRLYGNDISDDITPIEAGLSWIIKFDKEFIAKEILKKQKIEGVQKKLLSFIVNKTGKIPRSGYPIVLCNNYIIGNVTSGGFSPILKKGIGLGYVNKNKLTKNSSIYILIRNEKIPISKVKLPFINNP
ncbi:glycine cleavage system aminomethyltransferase GcvT [Blattabacterium cuenoti]|uniref:glycine cleavage system aminomethyltransferase GcvT n=1 Tax=Blattabacterium cuenoti TaxID=1653831 RepID=UPI00163C4540|nr:glycine cleavage system aminomethyltransferase GcvT [Blattabacterium cuenoti]